MKEREMIKNKDLYEIKMQVPSLVVLFFSVIRTEMLSKKKALL